MKILLINPLTHPCILQIVNIEPLGLEYLAAMLLPEHEVEIIDRLSAGATYDGIINVINNFQPQVIGISVAYSTDIKPIKEMTDLIKKFFPDILIVLGGNAATFTAGYLIKHPSVDIIVLREGEITFKELIEKWEVESMKYEVGSGKWEVGSGKWEVESMKYEVGSEKWEVGSGKWDLLTNIPGLCYKTSDKEIKFTSKPPLIENLDELPLPAHYLLKNRKHYTPSVLSGRGCAYSCLYCSTSAFFQKPRKRSVESIIKEVELLIEDELLNTYASSRIEFTDDNFAMDGNRVENLCDELIKLNEKVNLKEKLSWSCVAHIENLNEKLLNKMKAAGCSIIGFGVESGSPKVLKRLNRKYKPSDVIRVTKLCNELKILPVTLFMVGLPGEAKEDLEQTFSLIEQIPGSSSFNIFTPFPGTPVFDNPQKYGITILPHSPEEDNMTQYSWIDNGHLNREEIMEAYYKGLGVCIHKAKKFSYL